MIYKVGINVFVYIFFDLMIYRVGIFEIVFVYFFLFEGIDIFFLDFLNKISN